MSPLCREYLDRIRTEFLAGNDFAVASIIQELQGDQDLLMEVWACFPASMRRTLREIAAEFRQERMGEQG